MKTRDRQNRRKLRIEIEMVNTDNGQKPWAVVYDQDDNRILIPSFEDMFAMTLAIVECENVKYEGKVAVPADFVRRFYGRVMDAADWLKTYHGKVFHITDEQYEGVWGRLAAEFKIPQAPTRTVPPISGVSSTTSTPTSTSSTRTVTPQHSCPPGCSCDLCKEYPLDLDRSAA